MYGLGGRCVYHLPRPGSAATNDLPLRLAIQFLSISLLQTRMFFIYTYQQTMLPTTLRCLIQHRRNSPNSHTAILSL